MAIRSIENLKTTDLGETEVVICPVCQKATALRLFQNDDRSLVSHLKKKGVEGFAVCTKCASVFDVNPNYIEQKSIGTVCTLETSDLKLLVKGHV